MEKTELKNANEWFKKYNINTFILDMGDENYKMYVNMGDCELQLADDEIKFRASEYIRLKKEYEK